MSNLVDGKKIRDEILAHLKQNFDSVGGAVLGVVWVGDDPATAKFVGQKQKFAQAAGVDLRLFEYGLDISQEGLEQQLNRLALDTEISGIIVQLPLPERIDPQKIIDLIPAEKDVDALGGEALVLSPVVEAVKEILSRAEISLSGNKFVVLGKGKLVGRPVAVWLAQEGTAVEVLDANSQDITSYLAQADVIISGVGRPSTIKPEMVKDGVVIIDAGTSEQAGQLAGDADPACAAKASIFTPVPGGVGPIVIAMLFQNLWKIFQSTKR